MKFTKLAVVLGFAFASTSAYAFHSGGVAECEGCHSMHNSLEGSANVTGMPQYQSGPFLLKAQDQSGACLNCHQSADTAPTGYHISTAGITPLDSTAPVEQTPGGDFAWLKKTMTGSIRKTATTWEGDRHGHNVIAIDFGYTADKELTAAPGGSYPASALACSSCHDPHGRYRRFADGSIASTGLPIFASGSYTSSAAPIAGVSAAGAYRILAGAGYQPKSLSGSYAFANQVPAAVAPSSYNGVNTTAAGTFDRVAYGSGMSEWCANCHTAMHLDTYTSGTKGLVHPAGNGAKLTAPIAANYAAYVSSGIMTGTGAGYSALAPFETGNGQTLADYTALKAFQATPTAPTTSNNVLCLSCHRAHATAFESMARYYLGNEFMTVADSANAAIYDTSTTENKINTGYNTVQQTNAYNGRPATVFGPWARNYCNKCHAKD
jgi:mono/diheme cytochrome c family protein